MLDLIYPASGVTVWEKYKSVTWAAVHRSKLCGRGEPPLVLPLKNRSQTATLLHKRPWKQLFFLN